MFGKIVEGLEYPDRFFHQFHIDLSDNLDLAFDIVLRTSGQVLVNSNMLDYVVTSTNSGFNYGVSSRLQYDNDYIKDDIEQGTSPLMSIIDPNRVKNCNQCLSYFGPRQGHNGWGDSIALAEPGLTPAQSLVDIFSNRYMI